MLGQIGRTEIGLEKPVARGTGGTVCELVCVPAFFFLDAACCRGRSAAGVEMWKNLSPEARADRLANMYVSPAIFFSVYVLSVSNGWSIASAAARMPLDASAWAGPKLKQKRGKRGETSRLLLIHQHCSWSVRLCISTCSLTTVASGCMSQRPGRPLSTAPCTRTTRNGICLYASRPPIICE